MDTIFALATAKGRAGIAVIRLSGSLSLIVAEALCGDLPASGRVLRKIRSRNGDLIDEALILTFCAGESYTGEAVVEFQIHGSVAVINLILSELASFDGVREAEAGEFTRRALENGRLDLTQVEGLADLIDAETIVQQRQAVRVMTGGLGVKAERWRTALIRAAALLEATIDFADEEVPVDVTPEVRVLLSSVGEEMRAEIAGSGIAERIRTGFEVAIVGPPNAGKSTLLNRLAGRDAAITSHHAGTTRDVLEVRMDLGGLPVTVLDTAGIREAQDDVEEIGIRRGVDRARAADIRVHLVADGSQPELEVVEGDLVLVPKVDDGRLGERGISGETGAGVDSLVRRLGQVLSQRATGAGVAIRERHRLAMITAIAHLDDVLDRLDSAGEFPDLLAEELRFALRAVDGIVGRISVEDLLGEIFSSFCIGK